VQERTARDEFSNPTGPPAENGRDAPPPTGPSTGRPHYQPGRFGLGLRARATVAFGLIAFILSGTLAVLAYELTRSYLLDQRQSTAMRQAFVNARLARSVLRSPDANVPSLLSSLQSSSNSRAVLHYQGRWFASTVGFGPAQVPEDLRQHALAGRAGRQRESVDEASGSGKPYVVVGVPLPAADATYFEFTNLAELERTLRLLARGLALGAGITALSGAAVGRYASSRVVRPLKGMATVASGIAKGGLDDRLDAKGDRDLEPLVDSFNDMVDTLQERIHREARFASDVSHELRTPLAAIRSASNIVRRRLNRPEEAAAALAFLEGIGTAYDEELAALSQSTID
jgi:signal transduction histidine kinase